MTNGRFRKIAEKEAFLFEDEVKNGRVADDSITFQQFVNDKWLPRVRGNLKTKTLDGYQKLLPAILKAIGHIKLSSLQTGHLNRFYSNLQETGIRKDGKFKAKKKLLDIFNAKHTTITSLARTIGVSVATLRASLNRKNITKSSAEKISSALGCNLADLFSPVERAKTLDSNTVLAYHRLVSSILGKAVKWGYINTNPASNAELPKKRAKERAYLEEEELNALFSVLRSVSYRYFLIICLLALLGVRRGEVLGFQWRDVDFNHGTIEVARVRNYVAGKGVYTDTTKNMSFHRILKLSSITLDVL